MCLPLDIVIISVHILVIISLLILTMVIISFLIDILLFHMGIRVWFDWCKDVGGITDVIVHCWGMYYSTGSTSGSVNGVCV